MISLSLDGIMPPRRSESLGRVRQRMMGESTEREGDRKGGPGRDADRKRGTD
jgi:hypothetical protein